MGEEPGPPSIGPRGNSHTTTRACFSVLPGSVALGSWRAPWPAWGWGWGARAGVSCLRVAWAERVALLCSMHPPCSGSSPGPGLPGRWRHGKKAGAPTLKALLIVCCSRPIPWLRVVGEHPWGVRVLQSCADVPAQGLEPEPEPGASLPHPSNLPLPSLPSPSPSDQPLCLGVSSRVALWVRGCSQ